MYNVLEEIKKHPVFHYFAEISQIPRGSGNEKKISDYLLHFAQDRNLEAIQDDALNIIIKKPASKGYEHVPAVILQGHMDMVCEKNKGTVHDFEQDPIQLQTKQDMLYATNTTLGADNGIAVAYALALLDAQDLTHPALEIVITTEEETSMKGALEVSPEHFSGKIFINLDTEEEGTLLVSSAGGITSTQVLPILWEERISDHLGYKIQVSGLFGGHSGMSIQKGRGNANKILGRILHDLSVQCPFNLYSISGGLKSNAIPREAEAIIYFSKEATLDCRQQIEAWEEVLMNELRSSDPGVSINVEEWHETPEQLYSEDTTHKIVTSLMLIPNGVQSMSQEIEGLVESSTNLGVVTADAHEVRFVSEIRSSVKSYKQQIVHQNHLISQLTGSGFYTDADYPEWAYKPDSKVRMLFETVYKELNGKSPEILAIHAGLECGIFTEKLSDIDAISIGPDMFDVHTPEEHLSIPSTIRTWDYLIACLQKMNTFYNE